MQDFQRNCLVMLVGIIFSCTVGMAEKGDESIPYDRILRDSSVIAPGIGSESVLLGEDISVVIQRIGRTKFKISKPRYPGELFNTVFKISSKKNIPFELIYYHEQNKYACFIFQGKVVAVIGFDNNRVTTDSVNLRSGIHSFIFYYGNRNCYLLKANSNGIYLYPNRGIAVVDDGMNDSIDLYIVFAIEGSKAK